MSDYKAHGYMTLFVGLSIGTVLGAGLFRFWPQGLMLVMIGLLAVGLFFSIVEERRT